MRSRKVRSFLSAYCNGELDEKRQKIVEEHLKNDPSLRADERAFRAMAKATEELPTQTTSDDFNARLLDRIARERFAETRSNAMLPQSRPPRPLWAKLAPVAVSAMLVALVALTSFDFSMSNQAGRSDGNRDGLDDSYLWAQPDENPNFAVPVAATWSMEKELQRARQVRRIFSSLTSPDGFARDSRINNLKQVAVRSDNRSPYVTNYYQVRPIQQVYRVSNVREDVTVY